MRSSEFPFFPSKQQTLQRLDIQRASIEATLTESSLDGESQSKLQEELADVEAKIKETEDIDEGQNPFCNLAARADRIVPGVTLLVVAWGRLAGEVLPPTYPAIQEVTVASVNSNRGEFTDTQGIVRSLGGIGVAPRRSGLCLYWDSAFITFIKDENTFGAIVAWLRGLDTLQSRYCAYELLRRYPHTVLPD